MADPLLTYEHGPRTTEEARDALRRLVQNRWAANSARGVSVTPCFTIPVDLARDADVILLDVIVERDLLRARLVALAADLTAAEWRDAQWRELVADVLAGVQADRTVSLLLERRMVAALGATP